MFREHADFVWRLARHLGADPAALDDTVQDVFMVVFRRLDDFAGRSSVRTWLYGITRNVVRGQRRSRQREQRAIASYTVVTDGLGRVDTPAGQDASHDLLRMLDSLELSSDDRAIYVLTELYHMTAKEIGECLELNSNTVSSRLSAVRKEVALYRRTEETNRRVAVVLPLDAMFRADEAVGPDPAMEERVWTTLAGRMARELQQTGGSRLAQASSGPQRPTEASPSVRHGLGYKLGIGVALVVVFLLLLPRGDASGDASVLAWADHAEEPAPVPLLRRIPDAIASVSNRSEPTMDLEARATRRSRARETASSEDELTLIVAIRRALDDGDSTRALELSSRCQRLFRGRGQLEQERMASEVEALCHLGRVEAARRVADVMLTRWPDSPLGRPVRDGCAFR